MPDDERQLREADRLLAMTIYLMSCHARNACPRLACMVSRHLELVGRNPNTGELVRDTCRRLAAAWEAIRRHDESRIGDSPCGPVGPLVVH